MLFNITLSKLDGQGRAGAVAPALLAFGWAEYLSFLMGMAVAYQMLLTQKMVLQLVESPKTKLTGYPVVGG